MKLKIIFLIIIIGFSNSFQGSPLAVRAGGTGLTQLTTANSLLFGGASTSDPLIIFSPAGSVATQALINQGSSTPVWRYVVPGYTASGGFGYAGTTSAVPGTSPPNRTMLFSPIIPNSSAVGGQDNTGLGANAFLTFAGGIQNTAVGANTLSTNAPGDNNVAIGFGALSQIAGSNNIGIGANALTLGKNISNNIAIGLNALNTSTELTGNNNLGIGIQAGGASATTNNCVALGRNTLGNSTGSFNVAIGATTMSGAGVGTDNNVAIGAVALNNVSNDNNTACGNNAATGLSGGTGVGNNLYIGTAVLVVAAGDVNTIVIGVSANTATYLYGSRTSLVGASAVLVSSASLLGTVVSSKKYKSHIKKIKNTFDKHFQSLSVKTFQYKEDTTNLRQYGLLAEDVEKVASELVSYNSENVADSVQYHKCTALLINQIQNQNKKITQLKKRMYKAQAEIKNYAKMLHKTSE